MSLDEEEGRRFATGCLVGVGLALVLWLLAALVWWATRR